MPNDYSWARLLDVVARQVATKASVVDAPGRPQDIVGNTSSGWSRQLSQISVARSETSEGIIGPSPSETTRGRGGQRGTETAQIEPSVRCKFAKGCWVERTLTH